jgi:DNA-binding MarR family transcriptional regulator
MQNQGIVKLQEALEILRTSIRGKESRKELPVQMLATFLLVASNNGITMRDAAKEMGVEQSTVSRNVKDMDVYLEEGEGGAKIQKGCGLVFRAPNEFNRREFSVFLTAKGQKIIKQLDKILE